MEPKSDREPTRHDARATGPTGADAPDPHERERATDEAILRAVQADEPGAFDRFAERFGNRIYAFGRRMCGHVEDAEDVVQETLIAAHRALRDLREPGALTTWLYRVVANACRSRRRKSKFAPEQEIPLEELLPRGGVVEAGPRLPDRDGPESSLYRRELEEALEKAVRDLPPDHRVVWLMRDVEGLSTHETADALGISVPNTKMRLHRARLMLRKRLAHLRPGESE